ncbi:MAG: hypothetical protein OXH85_09900 [Truepera sp.]|nr:hypothetical protein [Truepera sp.]
MAGIWINSGAEWELGSPQVFQEEKTLHHLIQENPQLLPLAGSPHLMVLGSQIRLGSGLADILAVESSGRPTIIEVKLDRNPEARRSVVSQILAYAAFLQGLDVDYLEQGPLRKPLADAGYDSILNSVQDQDLEGEVDPDSFTASLQGYLAQGNFRLVLVLDEVSEELERLVAYLDAITVQALTIDLITLKVYDVKGAKVALPQRVSPDLSATIPQTTTARARPRASRRILSDSADVFRTSVEGVTGETRKVFDELIEWAEQLVSQLNVSLVTTGLNNGSFHLRPKLVSGDYLATIWNEKQRPSIVVVRSAFERNAPNSLRPVEQMIGSTIGKWAAIKGITPEVLEALTAAYQEASGLESHDVDSHGLED